MSLSTSNFRAIYLKIFIAISLGMSASMGLVRLFSVANGVGSDTLLTRVMVAKQALPKITAEEKDLTMFFGSSMVGAGFSPRQFDQALKEQGVEIKSFNFGFGGLNPFFQDYLSRRIRDEFNAGDKRLKLALIEFNPFQTTIRRHNRSKSAKDSFVTMLASDKEVWDITLRDPKRGLRMYNIRYLRDNVSAEMVTSHFGKGFLPPRKRSTLEKDEAIMEREKEIAEELEKRLEQDYPNRVPTPWSYKWQGGGTIPQERSAETLELSNEWYALHRSDFWMDGDRLARTHTADIIDLNFDEELVESFIRIVKNFQSFSDHVEVVLLPKNTQWIQNPPEALARMQTVLDRIERVTGVTIRNCQDLDEMTPEMFGDATHLNRYQGAVAFTNYLINTYSPALKP